MESIRNFKVLIEDLTMVMDFSNSFSIRDKSFDNCNIRLAVQSCSKVQCSALMCTVVQCSVVY